MAVLDFYDCRTITDIIRLARHDDDALLARRKAPDKIGLLAAVKRTATVDTSLLRDIGPENCLNLPLVALNNVKIARVQDRFNRLTTYCRSTGPKHSPSAREVASQGGLTIPNRIKHNRPAGFIVSFQRLDEVCQPFWGHSPHVDDQCATELAEVGGFLAVT